MKRLANTVSDLAPFFAVALFVLLILVGPVSAFIFRANESITPLDQLARDQQRPDLSMDGAGNGYAVWEEREAGRWALFFSYKPAGANWGPREKVNDNAVGDVSCPRIAVAANGDAYVTWGDTREGNKNIYFSKRDQGPNAWSVNVRVNDDTGSRYHDNPAIAVDPGGEAYAIWMDHRDGNGNIYFSRRNNTTGNWGLNEKVNDDSGTSHQSRPTVAVDPAGNAYAAWEDYRDGNNNIYFSRRNNASGMWGLNEKVNDDSGTANQYHPAIGVDENGNVYAIWRDGRDSASNDYGNIYFSKRDNLSGVWSANIKINDDTGTAYQDLPKITVNSDGEAYAVWIDHRGMSGRNIYFSRRSADPGGVWGTNEKVNSFSSVSNDYTASLGVGVDASGNVLALWPNDSGGQLNLYYAFRAEDGTWGADQKVNEDVNKTVRQARPHIGVDQGGQAYAIWVDARNSAQMVFADAYFSSRPAGGPWGANTMVENPPNSLSQYSFGQDLGLAIAADGTAYAVWQDVRNLMTNSRDTYFSYRPVGGLWQTNERVNDDSANAAQEYPAIALGQNGTVYAVWRDDRNGGPDLYFSYRPAGGTWQSNEKVNDAPGSVNGGSWDVTLPHPSIAVDPNGNAYAVWVDKRNVKPEIFFSYRPANGAWQPNVKVNDTTAGNCQLRLHPSIGVDAAGNAYAVWQDYRNGNDTNCAWGETINSDIYFSLRPAGGTWLPNVKVNDDGGVRSQMFPTIAVLPDGRAYAVWSDDRNSKSFEWIGGGDIYFSQRPVGGAWGANVKVCDDSIYLKTYPSIAVSPLGVPYVVWEDNRYTTTNIMFSYADFSLYLPLIIKGN